MRVARCESPARVEVFWPGTPAKLFCEAHAAKAEGVMAAMGLFLSVRPFSGAGQCEQMVSAPTGDAPAERV